VSKVVMDEKVRVRMGPYHDDKWQCATVNELLSTQFCAHTKGGRIVYGLFNMEGESWKRGW